MNTFSKTAMAVAVLVAASATAQTLNAPPYQATADEQTELALALEQVRIANIKQGAECRATPSAKAFTKAYDDYKAMGAAIIDAHKWPTSVKLDENSGTFVDTTPAKPAEPVKK